ncbi:hypothetical protein [Sphingoaurantiacus capsulatus]
MNWFTGPAEPPEALLVAAERGELTADLKLERLRRAIIDFPGRTESNLARIIYGRDEASLIAASVRKLEADGIATRDPETGGLYAARR